jgi:hypothetical protein
MPSEILDDKKIEIPKLFWMKTFFEENYFTPPNFNRYLKNLSNDELLEFIYSFVCYACDFQIEISLKIQYLQKLFLRNYKIIKSHSNKRLKYKIKDIKEFFNLLCIKFNYNSK